MILRRVRRSSSVRLLRPLVALPKKVALRMFFLRGFLLMPSPVRPPGKPPFVPRPPSPCPALSRDALLAAAGAALRAAPVLAAKGAAALAMELMLKGERYRALAGPALPDEAR